MPLKTYEAPSVAWRDRADRPLLVALASAILLLAFAFWLRGDRGRERPDPRVSRPVPAPPGSAHPPAPWDNRACD